MQLGIRLQSIETMVSTSYDHIWDCCCDHGLLGFSLLQKERAGSVHFVDIVPNLLEQIETKLKKHWQRERQNWQTHCLDVANLPVNIFSGKNEKHLIIIAGVGGELIVNMLKSLLPKVSNINVQFILSPVHHHYQLRSFLIENKLALINESLVFENNRAYEILHLSSNGSKVLSKTGSLMWDFNDPLHHKYLQKKIKHYTRMAKNPQMNVSHIINDYRRLLVK